jgi:hypothetical protein
LRGQVPLAAPVGVHDVDVAIAVVPDPPDDALEGDLLPVGRPDRIVCPSGDQAGTPSNPGLRVRFCWPLPSAFMT